jgi:AcrR family transcriptional regulator
MSVLGGIVRLVDHPESLRERKKAATRLALHNAAQELVFERGLDAVTVEAIADAAGVSRRTFSNYFANKECALLHGDQLRYDRLLSELRARPADEPPWTALRRSAVGYYESIGQVDPELVAQLKMIRKHPSLLVQQVVAHVQLERRLGAELAERSADAEAERFRSRLLAGTFLAALRSASQRWLELQGAVPLIDVVLEALDAVAAPLD